MKKNILCYYLDRDKTVTIPYGELSALTHGRKKVIKSITKIYVQGDLEGFCFSRFPALREVLWDNNSEVVPESAFKNCRSLEEIILPDQIKVIDRYAFYGCVSLKKINLQKTEVIRKAAFFDCHSLKEIDVPHIQKVGAYAFAFCVSLQNIDNIIATFDRIPAYCFYRCESIQNINFPDNLQIIGNGAFSFCTGLKTICFPEALKLIDFCAFERSGLTEVNIPKKTFVNRYAFSQCKDLRSVSLNRLPWNIRSHKYQKSAYQTAIDWFAFSDCENLTEINDNAQQFEYRTYIFCGCSKLQLNNEYNTTTIRRGQEDETQKTLITLPAPLIVNLPGRFEMRSMGQFYRHFDCSKGRLFVNKQEEHILLEWSTTQEGQEIFTTNIPANLGNGKKKDLFIQMYDFTSAHYYTFTYTYEHAGREDEIVRHGYMFNERDGDYYMHRVYLEKGTYAHEYLHLNYHPHDRPDVDDISAVLNQEKEIHKYTKYV